MKAAVSLWALLLVCATTFWIALSACGEAIYVDDGAVGDEIKVYLGEPLCETVIVGDLNGDCVVDLVDIAVMALNWGKSSCPYSGPVSTLAYPGPDCRLVYGTYANCGDARQLNILPDWSYCGYKGGGVKIPDISTSTTARVTLNHLVHMTSIVRHLFSTFEARKESCAYELSEHTDFAVDNTRSAWRSVDTVNFGIVATATAPQPTHRRHPEPARRSNRNLLSFFSPSF